VSEVIPTENGARGPSRGPVRLYILIAAVLVIIIVAAAILLVTQGLPALRGAREPTASSALQPTATLWATFTPRPTQPATATSEPTPLPTAAPVMAAPQTALYVFQSAGARPGAEWTGFFGTVQDASGAPLAGVPLIVWYPDGQPASPAVETDEDGYYEIHLEDLPLAGTWTLQVLTEDGQPASELVTFQTDENTETGIQQIQVLWQRAP
jgi:hypothetical protein